MNDRMFGWHLFRVLVEWQEVGSNLRKEAFGKELDTLHTSCCIFFILTRNGELNIRISMILPASSIYTVAGEAEESEGEKANVRCSLPVC